MSSRALVVFISLLVIVCAGCRAHGRGGQSPADDAVVAADANVATPDAAIIEPRFDADVASPDMEQAALADAAMDAYVAPADAYVALADAYMPPRDMYVVTRDMYVVPDSSVEECSELYPELPSWALPRCSSETVTALSECTTSECLRAAIESDSTPSIDLGSDSSFTCSDCLAYQATRCAVVACPTQSHALDCCFASHDCWSESDQSACMERECAAEVDEFTRCVTDTASHCSSFSDESIACFTG